MKTIRLGIGQINPSMGDIKSNCAKIVSFIKKAEEKSVDIISFPELSITGCPPEDLLLNPQFIEDNIGALNLLKEVTDEIVVVVGFVDKKNKHLHNSFAVLYKNRVIGVYDKIFLPEYGVFDEKRYFTSGENDYLFNVSGLTFKVTINQDIFHLKQSDRKVELVININASPYQYGTTLKKEEELKEFCIKNNINLCYTNLVGGQDELVFDGNSFVSDCKGNIVSKAEGFKEELLVIDIPLNKTKEKNNSKTINIPLNISEKKCSIKEKRYVHPSKEAEVYTALTTGLKDYSLKNNFKKTTLGLSGGIDSALVATIAADALGKENVLGVFMPSRYTSKETIEDSFLLAENLGIELLEISIEPMFSIYLDSLKPIFKGKEVDTTEENIQARIRGNILLAISNKFGHLVLTTGNKSEISVGYSTLYGDMAGGLGIIKDIYKTFVYTLSRYRNSISPVIPERVLTKAPTAELKYGQKDQDTLPPYEILDLILIEYIEKEKHLRQILELGFDENIVKKVLKMVTKSAYKRRQAPPGIKITPKPFRKDIRESITNLYSL
jgi:NAD+ synthase (glutamine-hydrolysing)